MISGLHVSASALRLLGDCPRAWAYRYLRGFPQEDLAQPLVLGRAVHAALAHWFDALREGKESPTTDELVAIARRSIEEALTGPVPLAHHDEDPDAIAEAERLLRAFAVAPLRPARILAVELPFMIKVGQHPITGELFRFEEAISGVFDLVVEADDGIHIIDHKVASRRPSTEGGLDLQLALYALAARDIFQPTGPVRLFHHVLVRTKVPRIELREIERTPHDVAEALEAVASGVEMIHTAVGHPRPMRLLGRHRSWRCGSCPFRRRCAEDRS